MLAPAVLAQLAPGVSAAVLDCELLVWNVKHRRPEPFNLLRPAMTAAMNPDGADMDEVLNMAGAQMGVLPPGVGCDAAYEPPRLRDVTLLFAVFDVLRVNDDVLIDLPLRERHAHLRAVLRPAPAGVEVGVARPGTSVKRMTAHLAPVLPGVPFMPDHVASVLGSCEADVVAAFKKADVRGDEGIVVKLLASRWVPGDHKGGWFKLKPAYGNRLDIDALVLGGKYGGGTLREGVVSEYVVGLLSRPLPPGWDRAAGLPPGTKFLTFARLGTGMTADERQATLGALRGRGRRVGKRVPGGGGGGGGGGGQEGAGWAAGKPTPTPTSKPRLFPLLPLPGRP